MSSGDDGAGDDDVATAAPTLSQLSPHPEVVAVAETLAAGAEKPGLAVTVPEELGERATSGARYGRFEVRRLLGHGGMGVVLAAVDPELDREVAIKVLHTGLGGEALQREAQAMARLAHPNVVTVFEVGRANDQMFIAMELCTGGSLGTWQRAQPRPWREVVARYAMAGRGLAAAHELGLVHRDFKPDNVLIAGDGTVKVSDFGLVRRVSTTEGSVEGTPVYMSPEQLRGEAVDARADQFSFAVALWEGVYGVRPFQPAGRGDAIASMQRAIRDAAGRGYATSNTGVPVAVRRILERGLAAAPGERWPSMTALLDALERTLRPSRRRMYIALAASAAVASVAITVLVVYLGRSRPPPLDTAGEVHLAALRAIAGEARAANDVDTEVEAHLASYDRAKDPVHLLAATRALARASRCRQALHTASAYEVAAKVRTPPTSDVAFELVQLRRRCELPYMATDDPVELERLANRYLGHSDLDGVVATLQRLRSLTTDAGMRARYVKRIGDYAVHLEDCATAERAYKTYLEEEPRAVADGWTELLEQEIARCNARVKPR